MTERRSLSAHQAAQPHHTPPVNPTVIATQKPTCRASNRPIPQAVLTSPNRRKTLIHRLDQLINMIFCRIEHHTGADHVAI
jgi:hypothetical protein